MSVTTPIVDFVRSYAQSGKARFHMPGHKGKALLGFEPLDITEIKGADELYDPEGIIAESEQNATRIFGTEHTYYSTEGSSQCIRAMLCLAMQAAPIGQRPLLLAARNAHKALLYAAALLDFDIRWLWPAPQNAGALCSCPVETSQLEAALQTLAQQQQKPFGVYLTSPDYLGGVQDISALAQVCKRYDVPLLVDNAHGAYLHFLPGGSQHPIRLGAAMCCDSGHKTLPVVTGGAYLHLGPAAPVRDEAAVRNALSLFGSTSPSYLILQSLDRCNVELAGGYPERIARRCAELEDLRKELNLRSRQQNCPVPLVWETGRFEPLKFTLDAASLGQSGTELAQRLRSEKIECEYADPRYVVLMFTPENPSQDLERLCTVLRTLLSEFDGRAVLPQDAAELFAQLEHELCTRCTIRQAVLASQQLIPVEQSVGCVCAMPTVSCPPAIPIVVSGEQISSAAVRLMRHYHIEKVSVVKK